MNARTYRGYTLSEAQSELQVWKAAKRYAAVGKSAFFSDIVDTLGGASRGPVRVQGVVIR